MSEIMARREEVAAKRAALTDGRWRNREGIGMYQRATSNALRDMLSELKPAQPSQPSKPRARTKSRSWSRSPRKRKSIAAPVESPQAGPSRIQMDNFPEEAPIPESPVPPAAFASPSRRASFVSAPLRSVHSPMPQPKPVSLAKPKTKTPSKPKAKQKASRDDNNEPEMTVAALLKQRRAKLAEEEARKSTPDAAGEEDMVVEGDTPMEVAEPSTSTKAPASKKTQAAKPQPAVEEMEDEATIPQENEVDEEQPNLPNPKTKSRIQTIIPEPVQPSKSKPKKRIEDPKHNPKPTAKSKGKAPRGKKKKTEDEDEQDDEEVATRKVSGAKRPTPSDDEVQDDDDESSKDDPGPSAPKRAKTKTNPPKKPKAKSKAKPKSKPRKAAKSASTSTSGSYYTVPESPELPEARDIMVPLQDSPRPKSKSNRRRYTLMPIRTESEMAHPDYDPIDCIGWQ